MNARVTNPDRFAETVATRRHQAGGAAVTGLGDVPDCTQQIRLVGAVVVPDREENSFAYLETNGATMLYRVGGRIGGLEVVGIRERRVFVRPPSGPVCQVAMHQSSKRGQEPAMLHFTADGVSQDELERGIKGHGDGMTYSVSRSLFNKALSDWTSLSQSARAVPYEENGQVVGVRLLEVRDLALLARLGFKSGDVIRAVNEIYVSDLRSAFSNPGSSLSELQMLGEVDSAHILVFRNGELLSMEYIFQ